MENVKVLKIAKETSNPLPTSPPRATPKATSSWVTKNITVGILHNVVKHRLRGAPMTQLGVRLMDHVRSWKSPSYIKSHRGNTLPPMLITQVQVFREGVSALQTHKRFAPRLTRKAQGVVRTRPKHRVSKGRGIHIELHQTPNPLCLNVILEIMNNGFLCCVANDTGCRSRHTTIETQEVQGKRVMVAGRGSSKLRGIILDPAPQTQD